MRCARWLRYRKVVLAMTVVPAVTVVLAMTAMLAVSSAAWAVVPPSASRPVFTLLGTDGQTVTHESYRGQWQIVFFGFTRCPDVCPAAMSVLTTTLRELGSRSERIRPLFVTVDPVHDTPAVLADYIANFDSRIVALTGSKAQIDAAARTFLSRYSHNSVNGEDQITHLALFYVVTPDGRLAKALRSDLRVARLKQELEALLQEESEARVRATSGAERMREIHAAATASWRTRAPAEVQPLSFLDASGADVQLSRFRGRVVLLNVWATWCAPCLQELHALDRLQKELGGADFQVVALATDRRGSPAVARAFERLEIRTLPIFVDPDNRVGDAFSIAGLPTTILIDRQGREIGRVTGAANWDAPELLEPVRRAIAEFNRGA